MFGGFEAKKNQPVPWHGGTGSLVRTAPLSIYYNLVIYFNLKTIYRFINVLKPILKHIVIGIITTNLMSKILLRKSLGTTHL